MAINHADCDHPRTPAGRAACRKAGGPSPDGRSTAERRFGMPRTDGMTTKERARNARENKNRADRAAGRMAKRRSDNMKRPGTHLRTISDLPDVPRMLAHGCRIAWDRGWDVTVGHQFNDRERRIVIAGTVAEIALVWRPTLPDGVWGVFVRHNGNSVTSRVNSIQEAFDAAETEDAWDGHGRYVGL